MVSKIIGRKNEGQLPEEDKFDIEMRQKGRWNIESWRTEKTTIGPYRLRVKERQDPHDGRAELYADAQLVHLAGYGKKLKKR